MLADACRIADASENALAERDRRVFEGSAAALVERYVKTPVLQATLATDGLIGTHAGPRDAGTALVLAYHDAGRAFETQGAWGFVRGGMGAIAESAANAARAAGAEIRTSSTVARIVPPQTDAAPATVVLEDGTAFSARIVLSNADPQRTFGFLEAWPRSGGRARTARDLAATRRLPKAEPRPRRGAALRGTSGCRAAGSVRITARRSTSRPTSTICKRRTRTASGPEPPPHRCSNASCRRRRNRRWRRPDVTCSRSSRSIIRTIGRTGAWTRGLREAAADAIVATLARYAPNLPDAIEARQILAPPDIEARFGIAGGQIFHGEILPGQMFAGRFAARTGVPRLYLCGSGAHPGGCVSGLPGTSRGDGGPRRPRRNGWENAGFRVRDRPYTYSFYKGTSMQARAWNLALALTSGVALLSFAVRARRSMRPE